MMGWWVVYGKVVTFVVFTWFPNECELLLGLLRGRGANDTLLVHIQRPRTSMFDGVIDESYRRCLVKNTEVGGCG
jgi:hypothetical protein